MTKFILHGGFTKPDNELNRTFFRELIKHVPENGNVLFVYFASEGDPGNPERYEVHVERCEREAGSKKLNYHSATKENFLEEIKQAKAILFNGGSTEKLLNILRQYPDLRPLLEGKTVAGSSAGAYALSTLGAAHTSDGVREGLGFVPVRVICHYESTELPPNPKSARGLESMRPELELVKLRDCEWRVFLQD